MFKSASENPQIGTDVLEGVSANYSNILIVRVHKLVKGMLDICHWWHEEIQDM